MAPPVTFGEVPGVPEGSEYASRHEVHAAGLHRRTQHGISGNDDGCDAIVLNGGYVDDKDEWDVVIYTGEGGQDTSRRQVRDQEFTGGNRALVVSGQDGHPVRVIRGYRGDPRHSPKRGYRYDGLYRVVRWWRDPSVHGPLICRFRLERWAASEAAIESIDAEASLPAPGGPASPAVITAARLNRRAEVARWVKATYDDRCQVCGTRLELPTGAYSECAHLRPLGIPHDGPDDPGNVLCLCPNDHKRLDRGAIVLRDDLTVEDRMTGARSALTVASGHAIDVECVRYHRSLWP